MVSKPLDIGKKAFKTKETAEDYIRGIMDSAKSRGELPQEITDDEEISVLKALLDWHDQNQEKVGSGIEYFFVDYSAAHPDPDAEYIPKAGQVEILIKRTDQSEMDISALDLVEDYGIAPATIHKRRVKEALREIIDPRRRKLRDKAVIEGKVKDKDGVKTVTSFDQAKVVYRNPRWAELTEGFASEVGGWDAIELSEGKRTIQKGKRLKNAAVKDQWIDYWTKNAHPEVLPK